MTMTMLKQTSASRLVVALLAQLAKQLLMQVLFFEHSDWIHLA
jgi:hypothetical protein